jgi:hypothetical protein
MRIFWESLSEKDRRRYAAIEAAKFNYEGVSYICNLFQTSSKTIARGKEELSDSAAMEQRTIRSSGAGRKRIIEKNPQINDVFLEILADHTAGSPMQEDLKWTYLNQNTIVEKLSEKGHAISVGVVKQLLKKHDFKKRKAQKKIACGKSEFRDTQFCNIKSLTNKFYRAGNPVVSMDSKKKENLGNLYRDGKLYTRETICTFDHDFASLAEGVIIPHTLYDIEKNIGYVQLGVSHDTSEFAADSIRHWWYNHGRNNYPNADAILLLCDCGGSNNAKFYLFKQELQLLADEFGIKIRVAHYPPYCSKYNPIEHRLFPHITRACQGVVFTSIELVKQLMNKTRTKKGLKVFTHIIDKAYLTARKAEERFYKNSPIKFDKHLPQLNYVAIPTRSSL